MTAPALRIEGLTVVLGDTVVLDRLDLEVAQGETVALLGPSGSGKTTLLYTIAGLIEPRAGTIAIDGVTMNRTIGPERRSIGMVFQNYALWPHLDARSTVAYPLARRGLPPGEAASRADELLEMVGMAGLGDRRPDQLSGGQQQRVGLARALAGEPSLHLFDEPTAHLDAGVREALQAELVAHRERTGAAAVYTTHDAAEAMAVADRIAILRTGRIVQAGPPAEVYARPLDEWVAALTGPVSLLSATVVGVDGGFLEVALGDTHVRVEGVARSGPGESVLVVRPEWALLGGPIRGTVTGVRYDGPHTDYTVEGEAGEVRIRRPGPPALEVGATTGWALARVWACRA